MSNSDEKKFQFEEVNLNPPTKSTPQDGCSGCSVNPCSNNPNPGCSNCSAPCSAGCNQNCEDGSAPAPESKNAVANPFTWGFDTAKKPNFWKSEDSADAPIAEKSSNKP